MQIKDIYVYCKYFSKISTKSVITNSKLRNSINKSGYAALNKIKRLVKYGKQIEFSEIIRISKEFAVESKLLKYKKAMQAIKKIEENNGNASMIMLGNAVFSDKPFKGSIKFKISGKGAYLI